MEQTMPDQTASRADRSPQDVRDYIEEMLAELAELAAGVGDRRLAATLRLLALDAARAPERA
jgi:glutamate synthase domain-containing protein 2